MISSLSPSAAKTLGLGLAAVLLLISPRAEAEEKLAEMLPQN